MAVLLFLSRHSQGCMQLASSSLAPSHSDPHLHVNLREQVSAWDFAREYSRLCFGVINGESSYFPIMEEAPGRIRRQLIRAVVC